MVTIHKTKDTGEIGMRSSRETYGRSWEWLMAAVLLLAFVGGQSGAQGVGGGVDATAVARHMNIARERAGSQWMSAVDFLCSEEPDVGGRDQAPMIEPVQLFDNLFAIGRISTVVYAITTSAGIILIDSGYEGQEESVLMPGLAQLDLDPSNIKYVIIAHGHRDHFGGAKYLQDRFGVRVVMASADWDLVEQAASGSDALPPPTRDLDAVDGMSIVLGDTEVNIVAVPGHTPGAIGLVFPVQDGDSTHVAGLFGGTVLIAARMAEEPLQQYVRSIAHFAEVSGEMGVDVEIQNHPNFDGMLEKLAELERRETGAPHPFVVGEAAYQDFLNVISECTQSELARRGAG